MGILWGEREGNSGWVCGGQRSREVPGLGSAGSPCSDQGVTLRALPPSLTTSPPTGITSCLLS
jgi:hypothetical protein